MKPLLRLRVFVRPYRKQILLALLTLLLITGINLIVPAIIRVVIDVGLVQGEARIMVLSALPILGIGICLQLVRKTRSAIIPLAWFALELAVFATHKPWWSYYYVHNAIPLCWCAAIGLEAVWKRAITRRKPAMILLLAVYALGSGAWMASRVYLQISSIRNSPQTYSSLVLKEIERFKPFTRFIYTDEPIYSFHTGIPLPPKLGVIPLKRLWSGDMTNAKMAAELWETKPGVILLANDTRAHPFDNLLTGEYRLVYQDDKHRLYAHKTVAQKAKY